jgi:hypothetical protein
MQEQGEFSAGPPAGTICPFRRARFGKLGPPLHAFVSPAVVIQIQLVLFGRKDTKIEGITVLDTLQKESNSLEKQFKELLQDFIGRQENEG